MGGSVSPVSHLLYLHGFRSGPASFKAQMLGRWLAEHHPGLRFWCPQLPPSPREAMRLVDDGTALWPAATSAVLGSSLGGFYATVVAEAPGREGWRCGVMNPAVEPARDLAGFVGEQQAYHDASRHFQFQAGYLDELRAMAPRSITRPERYAALIAKGDELLDWREMVARYPGAMLRLLEGGDHALSDFDAQLPWLLAWLGLEG